jgi:hypothetical protein
LTKIAKPKTATLVYNNIPDPLPASLPSESYQASRLAEFGTCITLAGTERVLSSFSICHATWGYRTKYPSAPDADWQCDITLNLYQVNPNDETLPGPKIFTQTRTFTIPWRPEPDPSCGGTKWLAPDGCHNGMAFTITFDNLEALNITLPDTLIYGIAYNTETGGYQPIGVETPSNDLNVTVNTAGPLLGTNPLLPDKFIYSSEPSSYADNGAAGINIYRLNVGAPIVSADDQYPAISVAITAADPPPPPGGGENPPVEETELQEARKIWTSIENWMTTEYVNATFTVNYDGGGTNHTVSCIDSVGNKRVYEEYLVGPRISVNPSGTSLGPGATQQFLAVAYGPSGPLPIPTIETPYRWSMEPGSLGTVDANSGLYTAPPAVPYMAVDTIRCQLLDQQTWTSVQVSLHP